MPYQIFIFAKLLILKWEIYLILMWISLLSAYYRFKNRFLCPLNIKIEQEMFKERAVEKLFFMFVKQFFIFYFQWATFSGTKFKPSASIKTPLGNSFYFRLPARFYFVTENKGRKTFWNNLFLKRVFSLIKMTDKTK